jgi:hypothetical protein
MDPEYADELTRGTTSASKGNVTATQVAVKGYEISRASLA